MKRMFETSLNRIKCAYPLGFFATLLMVFIMLIPDMNGIATETIICATSLWLPEIITFKIKLPSGLKTILGSLIFYFLVILVYKILGISTAYWDIAAGYYGCVVCAVISIYSLALFTTKQYSIIRWAIYAIFVIVMLYVSKKGLHDLATMNVEEAISQESAAYGSSVMIFSAIALIGFLYSKRFIIKLIYLAAVLLALYVTIAIMQRGTNSIMTVILLGTILALGYLKKTKIVTTFFVSICAIVFFYYSGMIFSFIDYISDIIPSERIAIRLRAVNFFLQTGDAIEAGSSMASRTELTQRSFDSFFSSYSSFFLGIGDHRGDTAPIGNHAEIIDTMARYGIFVFLVLCSYFIKLIKWWYNVLPKDIALRYQICCILLIYVARNIWGNAMTSAISILLFLYMPLVVFPILKPNKKKL